MTAQLLSPDRTFVQRSTPPPARLARVLGVFGGVLLTLSCITPASSLFILVPPLLHSLGSGAPVTLVVAGLISIGVGFCYAELGTLVPSAGGEYAIIGALLGRAASWLVFALTATMILIIPPVIALGTADYLSSLLDVNRSVAGAVVMVLSTLIALLDVRSNALVTGIFLGIEMLAAALVSFLGFSNAHRPVTTVLHPVIVDGSSGHGAFTISALLTGLAIAMFTFNGFGSAIYLAEEMKDPRRTVARTVLWSLAAAVVVILVPTVAVVVGARQLGDLATADFTSLVQTWAGSAAGLFISLCIAAAILNAVIVMVLQNARVLFSSGRDRAWPDSVNTALTRLHPRWGSPWLSTLLVGLPGAALALTVNIESLIGLTGAVVAVVYLVMAVAAFRARAGRGLGRAWRMPLWPIPPVLVIAALVFALSQQTSLDLALTGTICLGAGAYYWLYLRPRSLTHWQLATPEG